MTDVQLVPDQPSPNPTSPSRPSPIQPPANESPATRPERGKSWLPTRKWFAATVTALAAVASLAVEQDGFTKGVIIALIGAVAQAVVTYLLPNADTPGGVPLKKVAP